MTNIKKTGCFWGVVALIGYMGNIFQVSKQIAVVKLEITWEKQKQLLSTSFTHYHSQKSKLRTLPRLKWNWQQWCNLLRDLPGELWETFADHSTSNGSIVMPENVPHCLNHEFSVTLPHPLLHNCGPAMVRWGTFSGRNLITLDQKQKQHLLNSPPWWVKWGRKVWGGTTWYPLYPPPLPLFRLTRYAVTDRGGRGAAGRSDSRLWRETDSSVRQAAAPSTGNWDPAQFTTPLHVRLELVSTS